MVSYPVYFIDITIWQQDKICKNDIPKYRVFFLTHSLSRLAHQKCFDWPPPKLSKCWNHIHFARHLGVFRSEGGPVWDSNVFLKSVTYRPTLSKFRGGPVKKITLYYLKFDQCDNSCTQEHTGCFFNWAHPEFAKCWPVSN